MKYKLLIISIILICTNILFAQEKQYVSTIETKIPIHKSEIINENYRLFKINNEQEKDEMILFLMKLTNSTYDMKHESFKLIMIVVNQILSVRKYNEELVYIILSPKTNNLEIKQPYYYLDDKNLIFEVIESDKKENEYYSLRIYIVKKNEDIYKKVLKIDDKSYEFN
jgi:hypothetical protein